MDGTDEQGADLLCRKFDSICVFVVVDICTLVGCNAAQTYFVRFELSGKLKIRMWSHSFPLWQMVFLSVLVGLLYACHVKACVLSLFLLLMVAE